MVKSFEPGYRKLFQKGILQARVKEGKKKLINCNICPHGCGVNRIKEIGFCRAGDKVILSSYGPHFGEEKVLVGENGSGTIFFAFCNMKCVFCQNCELSFGGEGREISNEALAQIMVNLQDKYHCHNVNFVTPTHFVPNILEALLSAVDKGLKIPLVYNCGGYESIETLKLLEEIIDIFMPDFKYTNNELGERYSKVKDYPQKVKAALLEMDRQVGGLKTNADGIAYKGLIIRHLIMPGGIEDTKEILDFIKEKLSPNCLVNLMDQYYPAHKVRDYQEINRRITKEEYLEALNYAKKLGINLAL